MSIKDYQNGLIVGLSAGSTQNIIQDNPFALTDYIASSGTQYIDTDYIVQANTRFEAVYSGNTPSSTNFPTLYGSRIEWQNNSCQFLIRRQHETTGTYAWSDRSGATDEVDISMSSWFDKKNVFTAEQSGFRMQSANGFYSALYGANPYSGTPNNNLPIFLFALNDGGSVNASTYLTGKLYRFRIFEGDTLVHEFLPHVDENNVVCLKDTITNTIKYNAGSGVFTYGTDA